MLMKDKTSFGIGTFCVLVGGHATYSTYISAKNCVFSIVVDKKKKMNAP
jgi:C4-dicarboxylate transporter